MQSLIVLDPARDLVDAPPCDPHVAREARSVSHPWHLACVDGLAVRAVHAVRAVAEEHLVPLEVRAAP